VSLGRLVRESLYRDGMCIENPLQQSTSRYKKTHSYLIRFFTRRGLFVHTLIRLFRLVSSMPKALLTDASVCTNGLFTSKSSSDYAPFFARLFTALTDASVCTNSLR